MPVATSSVTAASGTIPQSVTVAWRVPPEVSSSRYYFQPIGDNAGFLVVGPGLPADGYNIWGCPHAPRYPQFAGDPVVEFPPFTTRAPYSDECYDNSNPQWAIAVPVPAGNHTWTVVPYWDTPYGRMSDVSSGATVTVNLP